FFFRLFEERISFASVLLLCMAGIFSMHVHEFTVLFLPVVFVYCLVMLCVSLAQRGGDGVFRLRYLLVTAVCVTAGLVTLCLKGGGFLSGLMSVPIWGRDVAANYNFYREMISKMYPVFTYMAPIAVLALIARKGREGLYTALNFIVPFVILSILTWKAYRYVYFIWPFFMIIAAGLLDYGLSALGTLRARLMRAAGSFGRQRLVGSCVSALIFLGALYPLTMPWIRMEPHEYRRFDIYDFSQEAQLIRELSWEEIIITTESLLLEFYTGRKPDYVIHIQEFGDQGRDGEYVLRDARGREFEKRSGVPLIKTRSMLEKVELAGRPVWIVANRNFFLGTGSRRRIDEGLRDYIVNSYRKLRKSEDVIEIYRKE
ncbi:MAG: hypothetical protein MJA29_08570, partial [Candidatus Omnitrophica bacterium]|nr:hypothetical protein [Candidatus Omnitrophota bacterium]